MFFTNTSCTLMQQKNFRHSLANIVQTYVQVYDFEILLLE